MKILDTSSTDDLRRHVPDWSVTKSRLGLPYAWLPWVCAGIALVLGAGWLAAANAKDAHWLLTVICGTGCVLFGMLWLLQLPQMLTNRRFLHATEAVLPDVPRTPLLIARPHAYGAVTHELVQTPSSIVLQPRTNPYGKLAWFAYLWPLFMAAVMISLVWTLSTFANLALFWKIVISLIIFHIAATFVWMVRRAVRNPPKDLAVIELNQLEQTCVLSSADESVTIDADQVIAVQLCAAWPKVEDLDHQDEDYDNKQSRGELELNLVWRNGPGAEASIERVNLMLLAGEFQKLVPIGRTLADTLAVPLLNHATPAHWRAERQRAKDRPYIAVGGAN